MNITSYLAPFPRYRGVNWSDFRRRHGVSLCNAHTHSFGVNPYTRITTFGARKLQTSLCRTVQTVFWYPEPFTRYSRVSDRQTDNFVCVFFLIFLYVFFYFRHSFDGVRRPLLARHCYYALANKVRPFDRSILVLPLIALSYLPVTRTLQNQN